MDVKRRVARLDQDREKYVRRRSARSLVESIGALSERWLRPNYPFRKKALDRLGRTNGFSRRLAEKTLDGLFGILKRTDLMRLLRCEIGDSGYLDGFCPDPHDGTYRTATGPGTILHIFSSNVPNPAVISFILGMLVKSANIGKCASDDPGLLALYCESLAEHDRDLARTNLLLGPGLREALLDYAEYADLIIVYGSDETLRYFRSKIDPLKPFIGYGHKISFGIYFKGVFRRNRVGELARRTAVDVSLFHQQGCLSPKIFYIESADEAAVRLFCECLAVQLRKWCRTDSFHKPGQNVWSDTQRQNQWLVDQIRIESRLKVIGAQGTQWKIVIDPDLKDFRCLDVPYLICLKPFSKIDRVFGAIKPLRASLQAVSVGGSAGEIRKVASDLAVAGFNRICKPGTIQMPPLTWRHDGRPNLSQWLSWTDWTM